MVTQKEILDLIPLYQKGDQAGKPTNENLRELHRLLKTFKFSPRELELIHQDVINNIPERTLQKRARESEGLR